MHAYMQMQKAGDEALAKAKRTRFRPEVDLIDVGQRMIKADDPELLTHLVLPLMAPKIRKTFPVSRVDDLLLYKPEESSAGEPVEKGREQMYVYEDEVAEERMKDNFGYLLRVLLDQLKQKKEVTLAAVKLSLCHEISGPGIGERRLLCIPCAFESEGAV